MVRSAIILAGGFGTRLQTVVSDVPKPMARVGGKPFLAILIDKIGALGIQEVVLSVGYLHEVIVAYFGDSYHGIRIRYAIETTPLGTGGAAALAMEQISGERSFLLNGDTYFEVDLAALAHLHQSTGADISVALKPISKQSRYGIVDFEAPWIKAFSEKQYVEQGLINGGVYCIERQVFQKLGLMDRFSFENDVLQHTKQIKIAGLIQNSYFIDIGIPSDFERAQTSSHLV